MSDVARRGEVSHSEAGMQPVAETPEHRGATPISIERARFDLEMQRLRKLREEQPLQRGVDPIATSPELVHAVARAASIWSVKRIAEALGMGRSTVHEWIARAGRDDGRARLEPTTGSWLGDTEITSLCRCVSALDALDRDGRQRVLNYLDERYFGRAKVKP